MNIDAKRCREYAEMFSKLADGTHTIEEYIGGEWGLPISGTVLIAITGSARGLRYRLIEKPRTPQTVTVYVWKDKYAGGHVFTTTNPNVGSADLLRTIEVSLDDDTVPANTAIPTSAAKSGIDWNALPYAARWAAMDKDKQWWWYEIKPAMGDYTWGQWGAKDRFSCNPCDDWRESLQHRPESA